MKAVIRNSGVKLVGNLMVADSIFARMKGLLGRDFLAAGDGIWLMPCNSVHTFGMRFAIDVVFLNRSNQVISVIHNLQPNRLTKVYFKAATVIEIPAHTAADSGLSKGDFIDILSPYESDHAA